MMGNYFTRFTTMGGGGLLVGLGLWIVEGGLSRPIPTPIWYWVGVGLMVVGTVAVGFGCRYGARLVKEEEEKLMDGIKESLVNINGIERDTATKMSLEMEADKEAVSRVLEECGEVLEDCLSRLVDVSEKREWDALAKYCAAVGQILDMHRMGLKIPLINNDEYRECKLELEKKRLRLKSVKNNRLIQSNIFRVENIAYRLSSFIILRGMLGMFGPYNEERDIDKRVMLEGIEYYGTAVVRVMLESLEDDWSEEEKRSRK